MKAAFPFMAIAVGATLLLEHLAEDERGRARSSRRSSRSLRIRATAFNMLDEKLLEAGIRADELNGNHLARSRSS